MAHPDLPAEQAYLDRAYECLERMREALLRSAAAGLATDVAAEAIEAWVDRRLATYEDAERGPLLRPDRPRHRRGPALRRPPLGPRRRRRCRRQLAGAGRAAVLHGYAGRAARRHPPPPLPVEGRAAHRDQRRGARRLARRRRRRRRRLPARGARARRDDRMRDIVATIQADQYGLIARDPRRRSSSRAGRARGRPRSGCIVRPTCSTRTARSCGASSSSARTRPSWTTSRTSSDPRRGRRRPARGLRARRGGRGHARTARRRAPEGDRRVAEVDRRAAELRLGSPRRARRPLEGTSSASRRTRSASLRESRAALGLCGGPASASAWTCCGGSTRTTARGSAALAALVRGGRAGAAAGTACSPASSTRPGRRRPEQVVRRLLASRAPRRAADGLLDEDEQRLLRATRGRLERWPTWRSSTRRGAARGAPERYGHVIVDEAQDLTPMQARMIARRAAGAFTFLGDVAQATGPVPYDRWSDVLAACRAAPTPRSRSWSTPTACHARSWPSRCRSSSASPRTCAHRSPTAPAPSRRESSTRTIPSRPHSTRPRARRRRRPARRDRARLAAR